MMGLLKKMYRYAHEKIPLVLGVRREATCFGGFTILEILITITIIGIVATLGFVNYKERNEAIRLDVAKESFISSFERVKNNSLAGVFIDDEGTGTLSKPISWGIYIENPGSEYIIFADEDDYLYEPDELTTTVLLEGGVIMDTSPWTPLTISFEVFTGKLYVNGEKAQTDITVSFSHDLTGSSENIRINPIGLVID